MLAFYHTAFRSVPGGLGYFIAPALLRDPQGRRQRALAPGLNKICREAGLDFKCLRLSRASVTAITARLDHWLFQNIFDCPWMAVPATMALRERLDSFSMNDVEKLEGRSARALFADLPFLDG